MTVSVCPNFHYEPDEIAEFDELMQIAFDLRWSWNHGADHIWRPLNPELWDITRNPRLILQSISPEKIRFLNKNAEFIKQVKKLAKKLQDEDTESTWFQKKSNISLKTIAYFSMEFMLGESLPIYSGGLGNVAGDQLKAASDLGVPVVGVGILYQQGYFRQAITKDGSQFDAYPINDPGQMPLIPARDLDGNWLRIKVDMPGQDMWVRVWQAKVGRVDLYLLDANDPINSPLLRGITSQLYGGGTDMRIIQEIILGIGGWRALKAKGLQPDVCHLNEGHAAFAVLERAYDFMISNDCSFDVALQITSKGNIFTTHTPVSTGFDIFSVDLMKRYFAVYVQKHLDIAFEKLMTLGRQNTNNKDEPFNMAYLAIRGSSAINGVSRLHGKVSRKIFQSLFPRWPVEEVPVGYVTNGIHVPTWDSDASDRFWTKHCGKDRWLGDTNFIENAIKTVPDEELWNMRQTSRFNFIKYVRKLHSQQVTASGASEEEIERAKHILDPNVLTLGFARRFVEYKRPTLLLENKERFLSLLNTPARPVQIIVAGKAHPADHSGQDMIRQWVQFTKLPEAYGRVVFISDHDMLLTEQMVSGVDVWINNPRRPWEACGTSGMKILANGGLNVSILDGWWAEAYDSEVGWAIGDGLEHGDDPFWDYKDADSLYSILENEVVPSFYDRDENDIPKKWITKMRESMARLTARFSAHRAVMEYTKKYYLPASNSYNAIKLDKFSVENKLRLKKSLLDLWPSISFKDRTVQTYNAMHNFTIRVYLGDVKPEWVKVELFGYLKGGEILRKSMILKDKLDKSIYVYTASLPDNQSATDFTARLISNIPDISAPLELNLILWEDY